MCDSGNGYNTIDRAKLNYKVTDLSTGADMSDRIQTIKPGNANDSKCEQNYTQCLKLAKQKLYQTPLSTYTYPIVSSFGYDYISSSTSAFCVQNYIKCMLKDPINSSK